MSALLWDNFLLDMGLRVWIEKLMFVFHLRSLDEESLARRTYCEQKEQNLPGLVQETKQICKELKIEDCNETNMDKKSYRILVVNACHVLNKQRILLLASDVKCSRIKQEEYGRKPYIQTQNIKQCRNWFRTRFGLNFFAGNYSHNKKYEKTNWMCR